MPKRKKDDGLGDQIDSSYVLDAYLTRSQNDFVFFTMGLVIPSARGPALFADCVEGFQLDAFRSVAPSISAVRDGVMPPVRRFWIERTKKAAKDSDLALMLLWLMTFPKRPVLVQVCAANQKQAGIVKRRAADVIHYNTWLSDFIKIQQNKIVGAGGLGEVLIEATDSQGGASHGETPDLLVLNELVHVARWATMETHMNNADGVPQGVVIVSTNAGVLGSKAAAWRKNALKKGGRWKSLIWSKKAPWVSDEDVADAKARDPIGAEFERLWKGRWISGVGGAVDSDSIDKCFRMGGPVLQPSPGWVYLAGLDLGISHDHAGIAAVGVHEKKQRIQVVYIRGFEPSIPNDRKKLEVDLIAVEERCVWVHKRYGIRWFGYDPAAGGSFMAQRLRKRGVPMREMSFSSPTNMTAMATSFVKVVKDGKLECYDDKLGRLRRDFGKFQIKHTPPSKYKLEAVSDEFGHADVGTALVILLPRAVELMGAWVGLSPDDDVADVEDQDWDDSEVEDMPDSLRGIYEACEAEEEENRLGRSRKDWL